MLWGVRGDRIKDILLSKGGDIIKYVMVKYHNISIGSGETAWIQAF
jgi:hypothetical protein|tara:strand:- start:206 stop:343 length:138 start_codon:yes stop_codon:yes gene_type:complete